MDKKKETSQKSNFPKIVSNRNSDVPLYLLSAGECFIFNHLLYQVNDKRNGPTIEVTRMGTGNRDILDFDLYVTPVSITITID